MRQAIALIVGLVAVAATPVSANAPITSLHPLPRPTTIAEPAVRRSLVPVYYNADIRPTPRPTGRGIAETAAPIVSPGPQVIATSLPGVVRSLRPVARPETLVRVAAVQSPPVQTSPTVTAPTSPTPAAMPSRPNPLETRAERRRRERAERRAARRSARATNNQPRSGSVCGDRSIRGTELAAIRGTMAGCGLSDPVQVTEIDGVALTQAATMNCETALTLKRWINDGVRPAVGRLGGGVASLRVAAHYACRTRNNLPGARVSEHGRGKAIDISAINLQNGSSITVEQGWRNPVQSQILKQMHSAACGPFGTVLGPNADRHHRDHFHLDTADHRGGSYCR